MATITKLSDPSREKPILPQACRSLPAVRELLRSGEVLRLSKTWTDPNLLSEAAYRLRQAEDRLLGKLPLLVWYGAFIMRGKTHINGRLHYYVSCICGKDYTYTTEELVEALMRHTGCREACCQQKTLLKLFWGTMADSLDAQWSLLQACYPGRLPSYWGGTLDEVYERDIQHGFVRAYQEMLRFKVDLTKPDRRWITPLNPELPFTQDNLELRTAPWGGFANLTNLAPVIAGQPIAIHELCESLDVTVEQVLDAIINRKTLPDDLVMVLLQKGQRI